MFTEGEATALLCAVALLRSLRATPFAAELDGAERKLRAALPEHVRAMLARAERLIGFETPPDDIFHTDGPRVATEALLTPEAAARVGEVVTRYVGAILARRRVALEYRSPYARDGAARALDIAPLGAFWDRERWYLVGRGATDAEPRLWRADRVSRCVTTATPAPEQPDFDIRALLDRGWLRAAMRDWAPQAPVGIALSPRLRARLERDWYYRHAAYAPLPDGRVALTYSDDDRETVFALLRWLGPEAELLEPRAWRAAFAAELRAMAETHAEETTTAGRVASGR
jgi:predicted DNA-binding transcriptional regulator YafY